MSRSIRLDSQFSSISHGRRDEALHPNVSAPFNTAAFEALVPLGLSGRNYPDEDSASESEDCVQMENEESKEELAKSVEDECDRVLLKTDSGYEAKDESPLEMIKETLQRRRKRTSARVYSPGNTGDLSPEDLDEQDRASIFPDSPKDAPYLPASEARRAALINAVAVFVLGHSDRSVADGKWNSIYTPASPPTLVPSCKPDPQTFHISINISDAKSSSMPRKCYGPQLSVERTRSLATARARQRKEKFVIKHPKPTQPPQPKQNVFKKGWSFLVKLKDMVHDRLYPSSFEIAQQMCRKAELRKWRAGRSRPMFSGKWVQSVAKMISKRRGKLRPAPLYGMPMIEEDDEWG